jgi:5-(carboxyamino)imidazole ribonucleotide mutase
MNGEESRQAAQQLLKSRTFTPGQREMAQRKAAPQIGLVMGSESDWDVMKHAAMQLDGFGVAYEARVLSAHRMPDEMF